MARLAVVLPVLASFALASTASAQNDLLAISDSELAALNAHDADAVLAFYANDATLSGSLGCLTPCEGKDAIRAELENLFADDLHVEQIDAEQDGAAVVRRLEATSVTTRAVGAERIVVVETLAFSAAGEILSVSAEIDQTDPQTAAFLAALTGLPATGAGPPPKDGMALGWQWLAAAGAGLLLAGVALRRRTS